MTNGRHAGGARLPQHMDIPATPFEVSSPEDLVGHGEGASVLVIGEPDAAHVDDSSLFALLGRKVVRARADSDAIAEQLGDGHDFALVVIELDDARALDLAARLRARPQHRSTPIVLVRGDRMAAALRVFAKASGGSTRGLEKLQEATAALSEARTPTDIAEVIVRLGADACAAHAAAFWMTRADGALVLERSHNIPDAYIEQFRVIRPDAPALAMRLMRARVPVWVENEADFAREAPDMVEGARAAGRVHAFAALPLSSAREPVALISFTYEGTRVFGAEDRAFMRAFARTCEQALERARLYAAEAEARRAAEALNVRKDEFLAMLGHELRNPLAAMTSALEIIKLRDREVGREISTLDRQVAHLTQIVGDLVDVARITKGKITLRREAVSLAHAIRDAIDSTRPLIEQHDVQVTVSSRLLVDADRDRLGQVILAVLTNAAKYTPARGRIEIMASGDGETARLVVRDNGRGIAAALLPNLFDLFVQGERSPDRREGGLGIGLTLARTIVDLHGGRIEAHSDGPGRGATFTIHLPQATAATATGQHRSVSRALASGPLRILIVDDNADAAEMLGVVIGSLGHEVRLAHDGLQGLELAQQFAPDVALLDIGLPTLDGYELAGRLRRLPACEKTRLIAVTGYGQPEDRERSRRAGFAHHLVKPVDLATLRQLLVGPDDDP